jgi:hypothetical protein
VLSHPLGEGRALRLLDDADAGELQALIEANRAHLSQWMPWAAGATLESTSARSCDERGRSSAAARGSSWRSPGRTGRSSGRSATSASTG